MKEKTDHKEGEVGEKEEEEEQQEEQEEEVLEKKVLPARSTRGKRIQALILDEQQRQADEGFYGQDYFQESSDDSEFSAPSAEEEDVVDADFDKSLSDDDDDDGDGDGGAGNYTASGRGRGRPAKRRKKDSSATGSVASSRKRGRKSKSSKSSSSSKSSQLTKEQQEQAEVRQQEKQKKQKARELLNKLDGLQKEAARFALSLTVDQAKKYLDMNTPSKKKGRKRKREKPEPELRKDCAVAYFQQVQSVQATVPEQLDLPLFEATVCLSPTLSLSRGKLLSLKLIDKDDVARTSVSVRSSTASRTKEREQQEQQRERDRETARLKRKPKQQQRELTQEELLLEAVETEQYNSISLLRLEKEEERKKKLRKHTGQNQTDQGPRVRLLSRLTDRRQRVNWVSFSDSRLPFVDRADDSDVDEPSPFSPEAAQTDTAVFPAWMTTEPDQRTGRLYRKSLSQQTRELRRHQRRKLQTAVRLSNRNVNLVYANPSVMFSHPLQAPSLDQLAQAEQEDRVAADATAATSGGLAGAAPTAASTAAPTAVIPGRGKGTAALATALGSASAAAAAAAAAAASAAALAAADDVPGGGLPVPDKKRCAVTGLPARYRDPVSGKYYATVDAFKEVRRQYNIDHDRRIDEQLDPLRQKIQLRKQQLQLELVKLVNKKRSQKKQTSATDQLEQELLSLKTSHP